MPNDRVRAVLKRLEQEDANERQRGLSAPERSRAVARTTGQFLFGLVAPQWDCLRADPRFQDCLSRMGLKAMA